MNCRESRVHLSALLDGSLDDSFLAEVSQHLDACSACASFHSEQRQLQQWLERTVVDLTAPPLREDWEEQFVGGRSGSLALPLSRLGEAFRAVQLRYALAGALALLLISGVLLNLSPQADMGITYLAELDAYHFESESNPFFTDAAEKNPFFRLGHEPQLDPFGSWQ